MARRPQETTRLKRGFFAGFDTWLLALLATRLVFLVFDFQELTCAKSFVFAAALSDRSFRASPSSLKRDVNNSIQGSNSANGTVAQTSAGAHTQWMMGVTVSSNSRSHYIWFCLFVFLNLLFFINEERNTVSSPPLQAALIEEVAYVKKIIVTGGTYTAYSS